MQGLFVTAMVLTAIYAAVGYAYTWLLVRGRLPPALHFLRRFTPFR